MALFPDQVMDAIANWLKSSLNPYYQVNDLQLVPNTSTLIFEGVSYSPYTVYQAPVLNDGTTRRYGAWQEGTLVLKKNGIQQTTGFVEYPHKATVVFSAPQTPSDVITASFARLVVKKEDPALVVLLEPNMTPYIGINFADWGGVELLELGGSSIARLIFKLSTVPPLAWNSTLKSFAVDLNEWAAWLQRIVSLFQAPEPIVIPASEHIVVEPNVRITTPEPGSENILLRTRIDVAMTVQISYTP